MTTSAGATVLWAAVLSLATILGTTAVTVVLLVRLPADVLLENRLRWPKTPPRRLMRIGRNLLGWLLVALGILLAVPGVPGQGLLTILVGLLLVDFPGRRRLLLRLLRRPAARHGIDRLRKRFGRPPLEWSDGAPSE